MKVEISEPKIIVTCHNAIHNLIGYPEMQIIKKQKVHNLLKFTFTRKQYKMIITLRCKSCMNEIVMVIS